MIECIFCSTDGNSNLLIRQSSSYFAGLALLYSDLNFPVQTIYMLLAYSGEKCGQEKLFLSSDNLSILHYSISAMLPGAVLLFCMKIQL